MSKGAIAFIVVLCIGLAASVIIFLKRSADNGKKRSDYLMEQFKEVEKTLHESNISIDSLKNSLRDSMNN